MNELDPSTMNEEQIKDFMAGYATREEINKYMNNMFASINNSFGMFQGYTINALALTIISFFEQQGLTVTIEEFMNRFFENNKKVLEEAAAKLKELTEPEKGSKDESKTDSAKREVDISMF